jgi:uncharacterized protein
MAQLPVHITPKAGRDEIVGWLAGELRVRVTTAPEGGKANAAVCRLVARELGVAKSSVRVVRGDTARHKMLEIVGVDDAQVAEAFAGVSAGE